MANEPDNLVLVHLREIRAMQTAMHADNSAQFARINERLNQLDKRFEDFHALTNHTLMLSTANDLRMRDLDRRYEFSEGEQRRITDRMDDFERRLSEVERKLDE
jgi:tetrahydromethanopterin S-methyltransferase subunit G